MTFEQIYYLLVPVWVGIKLVFFIAAGMVLCFGFKMFQFLQSSAYTVSRAFQLLMLPCQ